jgi:4-hydroxybenzoate polyprenyltransferase
VAMESPSSADRTGARTLQAPQSETPVRAKPGRASRIPPGRRIWAWLSLLRIRTTLSAPILTAVSTRAARSSSSFFHGASLVLVCASAFLLICFFQIINDVIDRDQDAVHKPYRAIPSGAVSVRAALAAMVASAIAGLVAAALVSLLTLGLATVILVLGAAYSLVLKGTVLIGNVSIAITAGLLYLLDITSLRSLSWTIAVGFIVVLLFILGDELFKTTEDLDGDSTAGIRTIATMYSYRVPAVCVVCCWVLLTAVFVANIGLSSGAPTFGLICLFAIGLPTGIAALISQRASSAAISRAHIWWKIGWTPGLIALAFIR